MAGSTLTPKEQERARILKSAIAGKITNAHAAKQLQLSIRQIQRIKAEIRKGGVRSVMHKLKGKPSNHAFAEDEKTKAIEIITTKYADFKPGFATGKITKAAFGANEGVIAVFLFWKEYIEKIGKPVNIYLDKFSTYKINHKSAVDNKELMTQFGRAMMDLAITLIPADSPQAKGRIERLFQTLQDRLIKEMRLANISTPEEGNKFLEEVFIPKFNDKFSVSSAKEGDIHRLLTATDKGNINRIFSVQSERVINNDFTIQFKNTWYQLAEIQPTTVRAREKVLVEEWLDGTIHFSLRETYLSYTELPERPKKGKRPPPILTRHKLNWKPPIDHPWRKRYKAKK